MERGSKENEKAQQPRKTVQKQYFSYLDIQHNRHAVLFQLRFLSPNLHNNSQLIGGSALLSKFILFNSEYQSEAFRAFLRKLIFRIFSN